MSKNRSVIAAGEPPDDQRWSETEGLDSILVEFDDLSDTTDGPKPPVPPPPPENK
jgi:hypothetical protein